MKKFIEKHKKDITYHLIFLLTYTIIALIITKNGKYILGSRLDFRNQHFLIPEYFRTLFYNTHNLFPSFAPNLAGGENIYYLSYYGLYNPLILISYLLPNISMLNYIITSMSILVLVSTSMFYFYLKKNKYSDSISFICAFLFLCSAPLIFHSHRHIMFIDYFPFLFLSFFGVDQFIEKKKSTLLIIGISLLIFTSYYFSVSALLVIFILGLYKYSKTNNKNWIKFIISFSTRFIIPVFITAILTIPTLYTLFDGREHSTKMISIYNLLKPKLYLLYSHYDMGLTMISVISVTYAIIQKKKSEKILGIIIGIISISPLIVYILNGFLYANKKVTIPFMPLAIILIAEFLVFILPKVKWKKLLILYILISQFLVCLSVNNRDELILKETIKESYTKEYKEIIKELGKEYVRINDANINSSYLNRIDDINEYKTSAYSSVHNKNYKKEYVSFFENPLKNRNSLMLSSSNNLLFEIYMGEKYILTKRKLDEPYVLINKYNDINIYKNDNILPIGYATEEYINEKELSELNYPENVINILGRVTTDKETKTEIRRVETITPEYEIINKENIDNIEYIDEEDKYIIKSKKNGSIKLKSNIDLDNKYIFIKFNLADNKKCKKNDLAIKINGIKNVLTCKKWKYYNNNKIFTYTITNGNELKLKFDKGTYTIKDIEFYTIEKENILNIKNNVIPLNINKNKTRGNTIEGDIKLENDSMFTISIPYDKGFNIKVNNKAINYKKGNNAFITFPLKKGENNIKIKYTSPYKNISLIISLIGIVLFIIINIIENKNIKNKYN